MERKNLRKEIEELQRLLRDRLREPADVDDAWARYLLEYSLIQRQLLMDYAAPNSDVHTGVRHRRGIM